MLEIGTNVVVIAMGYFGGLIGVVTGHCQDGYAVRFRPEGIDHYFTEEELKEWTNEPDLRSS